MGKRSERAREGAGAERKPVRAWWRIPPVLGVAATSACGADASGVSYQEDIAPLFEGRCTGCHHEESYQKPNMAVPFGEPESLVGSKNEWAEAAPGFTPEFNVTPFSPDESFLIDKIENPSQLPDKVAGAPMPLRYPRLDDREIGIVRQWIADGADLEAYRRSVEPIFGLLDPVAAGKCVICHSPGTPDLPDLTDPSTLVGVRAQYRTDRTLVIPGDPDGSFLVQKIEALEPSSELGSPMPYLWDPLTEQETALVARWILEGAQDN
jgi:mono/diheme cytochrome c family protein